MPRKTPAPPPDFDAVFSTREVMDILQKDRATVIRMGQEGRIRIVGRFPGANGAFLFDRASVAAYAAGVAEQLRRDAEDLTTRAAQ